MYTTQNSAQKKIVLTDNGRDIGITGTILSEDDFFLTVSTTDGRTLRIGKRAIVLIKDYEAKK